MEEILKLYFDQNKQSYFELKTEEDHKLNMLRTIVSIMTIVENKTMKNFPNLPQAIVNDFISNTKCLSCFTRYDYTKYSYTQKMYKEIFVKILRSNLSQYDIHRLLIVLAGLHTDNKLPNDKTILKMLFTFISGMHDIKTKPFTENLNTQHLKIYSGVVKLFKYLDSEDFEDFEILSLIGYISMLHVCRCSNDISLKLTSFCTNKLGMMYKEILQKIK
jgi:hypothetical protein